LFRDDLRTAQKTRFQIIDRVSDILDHLIATPSDLQQVCLIHGLSDEQRNRLLGAIDRVLNDVPRQLTAVKLRLEEGTRRLQEVETSLGKVPDETHLQPMMDQLNQLHRELGAAENDMRRSQSELDSLDFRLSELKRSEVGLQDQLISSKRGLDRRGTVAKVRAVLDDYGSALTAAKAKELSEAVVSRFAQLWRKGDVVRRIEINPGSFQVTLVDRHDRAVPKKQLSAGEKQIYAISMLWALAQVSGRPLPMVIDTPLGRLDSDHRAHLVQRYFSRASHQVIILSTDTEIDKAYFRDLSPEVSHAYHLRYEPHEARTVVEDGYFWSRREMELVHAD
jgi:DNA sulfur modification protein DndD